jgi:hypothetical protein
MICIHVAPVQIRQVSNKTLTLLEARLGRSFTIGTRSGEIYAAIEVSESCHVALKLCISKDRRVPKRTTATLLASFRGWTSREQGRWKGTRRVHPLPSIVWFGILAKKSDIV